MLPDLQALRFLDERPVKEQDHEAAIAWFRGGWEEEQKVVKAHREREQEILRGHVSTLRRLQEEHRQKVKLALDRIARENAEREAKGTFQNSSERELEAKTLCQKVTKAWLAGSGSLQACGTQEQSTDAALTRAHATSCHVETCGPSEAAFFRAKNTEPAATKAGAPQLS
ncbi:leucine rich repeat protein, putative [Eimeria necatrix]|uniref:Leucine rich repeat protein, putative n=1 Tax=Eimeria necatrix TaxID=51315 RepID=U6MN22_9EIME|nr:leucine rich repeat protein, putative [Eimeria necatrix]CDJ63025.1 leucine rich repeat protein, putative [Eimeria necatrix]